MARSAIPDFGIEYPEYVYRPWPKHVGYDDAGEPLTAKDQAEYDEMKERAAFPKILGKDKHGNTIIAHVPRDEEWLKGKVVAEKAADVSNALTQGAAKPGKAKAA